MVASASTEIDDFTKKVEKYFSLISYTSNSSNVVYEDSGLWLVHSRASSHMMGMRSVFHSVSETDLDYHVSCGASTTHAVKGGGCVRFQLDSGGFWR